MDYPEYKKRKTEEDLRREIMELRKKVNELEENVSRSKRNHDAENEEYSGRTKKEKTDHNSGQIIEAGNNAADSGFTAGIGNSDTAQPAESADSNAVQPAESAESGAVQPEESAAPDAAQPAESADYDVVQPEESAAPGAVQPAESADLDAPKSDKFDKDEDEEQDSYDEYGDIDHSMKYDPDEEYDDEEEYIEGKSGGKLSAGDLVFRIFTGLLIFAICITAVTAVLLATGRLNGVIDNFGNEEEETVMTESSPDVTPTVRVTLTPTPTPTPEATETPVPEAKTTKAPTAAPDASGSSGTESKAADAAVMTFKDVDDVVTAKETTNLRNVPSQGEESFIVYILQNGETLKRTGISDEGWSRLEYEGQVVYAMSNLLTTDLTKKDDSKGTGSDGAGDAEIKIQTVFTDVNEQVTPKIEVNLRKLPSVTNPNATVVATVKNGEVFTRTGVNEELGWSRVEYNGQTLYCISSYVETVTPAA